jgi:hypothetical protein
VPIYLGSMIMSALKGQEHNFYLANDSLTPEIITFCSAYHMMPRVEHKLSVTTHHNPPKSTSMIAKPQR